MNLKRAENNQQLHILIVDDEPTIIELLRIGLNYENFQVSIADNGKIGLETAWETDFDLIILDLMLPDLDGFEICRRLRQRGKQTPVIMLTARGDLSDRVTGLNLGADDYITKPFSFEEVLARIHAVLRRRGKSTEQIVFRAADLTVNTETREVVRDGKRLNLTPLEYALLENFMRHPRRIFTRETLVNRIWGLDFAGETNSVDVHISHLRRKIGKKAQRLIRTIYGIGYCFREDDEEME